MRRLLYLITIIFNFTIAKDELPNIVALVNNQPITSCEFLARKRMIMVLNNIQDPDYQKNKQRISDRAKEYYQKHKEERNKYSQEYWRINGHKYVEKRKETVDHKNIYKNNKEYYREYHKKYYIDNKQHHLNLGWYFHLQHLNQSD